MLSMFILFACGKGKAPDPPPPAPKQVAVKNISINSIPFDNTIHGVGQSAVIRIEFTEPVNSATVSSAVKFTDASGIQAPVSTTLQNKDSVLIVQSTTPLNFISKYNFKITSDLKSSTGGSFLTDVNKTF